MLFCRIDFQLFILFQIFWIFCAYGKLIPTTNDWEEINENWPILKNEISKDFFYFKTNSTSQTFNLKIKETIKAAIELQNLQPNQQFILSFKYWQSPNAKGLVVSVNYDEIVDDLVKDFTDRNSNNWMERKYSLTKDQINKFNIVVFTSRPEYVIAIKDLKVEYDLITTVSTPSHKMEIPVKLFSTHYSSSTEDIHSTENTLEDCSLNNLQQNCFIGSDWIQKTMEVTLKEFDTMDYCFDLEYSSNDPAIIEAYFIIASNKLENKFFSTKVNTVAATETAKLCLSDYLRIKAKTITIFFTAKHIYEDSKNDIKLRISYSSKTRSKTISDIFTFLPGFTDLDNGQDAYQKWKTTNNIGVKFDGKTFQVPKVSKHPANFRISSDWIKYDDKLSAVDMIFRISFDNNLNRLNLIRITPKICNEISYCFDVNIKKNVKKDDKKMDFYYNLSANLINTEYIKLVFDIEYFALNDEEIKFDLENVHFGNPCFNITTKPNFEECYSNPIKSIPNSYVPKCSQKWADPSNNCATENECWTLSTIAGKKQSGEKFCSTFGNPKHGLCTLDDKFKFKCICENDQKINWDQGECVDPIITDKTGWDTSRDDYYLNDKSNRLSFGFKGILTEKFDVCIGFTYKSKVQNIITVLYNEKTDIKTLIYLNPSPTGTLKKICVNDFNYNPEPDFKLSFVVENAIENKLVNVQGNFSISKDIKYSVESKKELTKHISKTDDLNHDKNSDWTTSFDFEHEQNKDSPFAIQLQTDWIELSPQMKNASKYNNHISLNLENPDIVDMSSYTIYMDKNSPKVKQNSISKSAKTKIQLDLPESGPFKMVVTIIIQVSKNDIKKFKATIDETSIGNPCSVKPCGLRTCTPSSFDKFQCDYKNNACQKNVCDECPILIDKDQTCTRTGEDSYDCNVFDSYFAYKSKSCTQKFAYNTTNIKCNGKNCNIFENMSQMKYSSALVPQFNNVETYFTSTDGSPLSFAIENYDAKKDHCLKINYKVSNKSSISINLDDNKPISFAQLNYNEKDKVESFENEIDFCLSDLAKTVKKNSSVNIVPKLGNNEFVSVVINDGNDKDFTELPFLMRKVVYNKKDKYWEDYQYDSQWSFRSPTKSWSVDGDGSITYTAQVKSISPLITSNWIEKYEPGLELRFNIDYKSTSIQLCHLQIVALDEKLSQIQIGSIDISKVSNKPINIEIKNEIKTSFKIGIRVNYTENLDKPEPLFIIKDIDIGDPCIESDGQNTPNSCQGVGYCERFHIVTNYTCHCDSGRTGIDCQQIDYCGSSLNSADQHEFPDYSGTGKDYCIEKAFKTSKCFGGGIKGFYCECGKGQFWDPASEKCADFSKCLFLGCNSIGQYCNSTTAKCECSEGFKADPKNQDNCLRIDPCDDKKKCNRDVQQKAICISNADNTDYSCVCSFGYKNQEGEKEDIKCESKMCESPILNNCEQFCTDDNKNGFNCTCDKAYNENGNKCSKKKESDCKQCTGDAFCADGQTECKCKNGYKLNGNKCEPESDALPIDPSICPGPIEYNKNTSNWDCNCGLGFKWDNKNKVCSLDKICSANSDARNNCTAMDALCLIDLEKLTHECVCPTGLYLKNKTKCVTFCELDDKISSACSDMNAICNLNYFTNTPITDIDNIDHKKHEFCACNPGYYNDGNNCIIGRSVVKFTFVFKKNFEQVKSDKIESTKGSLSDSLKKSSYYESIQKEIASTIAENIALNDKLTQSLQSSRTNQIILDRAKLIVEKTSFSNPKSFSISSCKLDKDLYTCEFILDLQHPLNLTKKDIFTDISDPSFCIPLPDQQDYCIIPGVKKTSLYDTTGDQIYTPIVVYKKALSPSKYIEPCTDRLVNCEGYSHCEPEAKSTGYSCVCGKGFKPIKLPTPKFGQTETYDCQVDRDSLCKAKCPGINDGYCTVQVSNDKKSVSALCGCKEKYKLTNNDTQCVDACDGIKCSSNGKCQYSGYNGYQCVCTEGYYGETCDKEQTLSKGGWIAGIVVLAVLVVIVSGVAFMFARRSRNNSQPETGRPMEEYTGSSYRVPSQSRGQTNQSYN